MRRITHLHDSAHSAIPLTDKCHQQSGDVCKISY